MTTVLLTVELALTLVLLAGAGSDDAQLSCRLSRRFGR